MARENTSTVIRCVGCRCILMDTKNNGLLDAHSDALHSATLKPDTCSSVLSRANLYLDDENLPEFAKNAVVEAGFTSGRLKCAQCGSRLGAFNFVKGSQCVCSAHTLPPVHLSFSKVDYLGYSKPLKPLSPASAPSENPSSSSAFAEEDAAEPLLSSSSEDCPLSPLPSSKNTSLDTPSHEASSQQIPSVVVVSPPGFVEMVAESPASLNVDSSSCQSPATNVEQRAENSEAATSTPCAVQMTTEQVVSGPELFEYPDHLVCAICLELLFSPFAVKPCEHIFCEPCLRRLARPAPTNTACPLCREIIGACQPAAEYSREVKEKFPKQLAERQKFEQSNCTQNCPLPWLQNYRFQLPSSTGHRYSRNGNWWRTALWIFWVDAVGFLLVITLNWILTQTIHKSEEQMPSFPHLPTSRKIPILESSNGGSGDLPYYLRKDPYQAWNDKYAGSDGFSGDGGSTNYFEEQKRYHPVTASPIPLTTYSPSAVYSSQVLKSQHPDNSKENPRADYSDEDGGPGSGYDPDESEEQHISKNSRMERLAKHFFNAFDNFDDGGISLDLPDEPTPPNDLGFNDENKQDTYNDGVKRFRRKIKPVDRFPDGSHKSRYFKKGGRAIPSDGVRWWAD